MWSGAFERCVIIAGRGGGGGGGVCVCVCVHVCVFRGGLLCSLLVDDWGIIIHVTSK